MSDTQGWSTTRILIVDDDESARLHLQQLLQSFRTQAVSTAREALEWIHEHGRPEVLLTDSQLPGESGLQLLERMRTDFPQVVRVLRTGPLAVEQVVRSVNRGSVFRIVGTDDPSEYLLEALQEALLEAERRRSEREHADTMLAGVAHALGEALALANPVALGHTLRVARRVDALAAKLDASPDWEIAMATRLSQLGTVHIPAGVFERVLLERELRDWEETLYQESPQRTVDMLKGLPGLDGVRAIIRWQQARWDGRTRGSPKREAIPLGARILHVAIDADRLEMQGHPPEAALAALTQRYGVYDPEVLEMLRQVLEEARVPKDFVRRKVPLTELWAGMVFGEDLYTNKGLLLTNKGTTANPSLLERIRSFALAHGLQEEVDMYVPSHEPDD